MHIRNKCRVLVVDDHPITRLGLAAIIETQPDMQVCGQAGSGEEAVRIFPRLLPNVILMDLRLPVMSGMEALRAIRRDYPYARCLILTTYEGDEDIHQAMEAGALGYVIKGMSTAVLVEALRRVHNGCRFLPAVVADTLAARTPNSDLSAREREVLSQMVHGRRNKEIASALRITEATVKCHVSVILGRLQVGDRTNAVMKALHRGLAHL